MPSSRRIFYLKYLAKKREEENKKVKDSSKKPSSSVPKIARRPHKR